MAILLQAAHAIWAYFALKSAFVSGTCVAFRVPKEVY